MNNNNFPLIGYLSNPDKVFYNYLDNVLIKSLISNGAKIINLNLENLSIKINKNKITILNKNKPIELDGFISYGYMSKFHFEGYKYILEAFHKKNIPLLYSPKIINILSNKYLQSLNFIQNNIPIPSTGISFSIEGFKNLAKFNFNKKSVLKELFDYGGDGVSFHENKESLINSASKKLWKNEYSLFQKYISDSFGRSIRVLFIEEKPIAIAEYVNKNNNFKSNNSFGYDNFSLVSLMKSDKRKIYENLAKKAVNSINFNNKENMLITGVDILDSKKFGNVILEVNPWPDIFDIQKSTNINVFDALAKCFVNKVKNNMNKIKI